MTPIVSINHVSTLSMTERNGVITGLTRLAVVTGLVSVDYSVLMGALEQAGIPAAGSGLAGTGFSDLVLVQRNPRVANDDSGRVDVELVYGLVIDNQNLSDTSGTGRMIFAKSRASAQQTTTNFYRVNGQGDPQQILVQHTFPADDPDYPGQTIQQGGEIKVMLPETNIHFEGYVNTYNPSIIRDALVGTINAVVWSNHAPGEWMCMEVGYERIGVATNGFPRYHFTFEFQHNYDGWNPTAVFTDQRTGQPPPNLVPDVGFVTIPYHRPANFDLVFGSYFEGWQQIL